MSSSGWILTLISAGLAVSANLLLRIGVEKAGGIGGELSTLFTAFLNLLKQPAFNSGILMYAFATLVWVRIISIEPLSVAYPLLVSITFLLVTFGAAVFLKETVTISKVIGLLLIISGILLLSQN
jgi:multidrug transporter EmrE-like cation transporter